jgi:hypothetical protein
LVGAGTANVEGEVIVEVLVEGVVRVEAATGATGLRRGADSEVGRRKDETRIMEGISLRGTREKRAEYLGPAHQLAIT